MTSTSLKERRASFEYFSRTPNEFLAFVREYESAVDKRQLIPDVIAYILESTQHYVDSLDKGDHGLLLQAHCAEGAWQPDDFLP